MIRRPLFLVAAAFTAAIIISYYMGTPAAFIFALVFIVILFLKKGRQSGKYMAGVWVVLFFYMFGMMDFQYHSVQKSQLSPYANKHMQLTGQVVTAERKKDDTDQIHFKLKVDVFEAGSSKLEHKERVLLDYYIKPEQSNSEEEFAPSDIICATGTLMLPSHRRNPGCFDYALYLKSMNINVILRADKIIYRKSDKECLSEFQRMIYIKKEQFLSRMEEHAGESTSGMMRAILFGEKGELDEDLLEEFQKNGTAHILAVSGLHIGIIYGFINFLWPWKKNTLFFVIVMLFFTCYMFLSSFSPSVVRAVSMIGLHIFASITNRRYDVSSAAMAIMFCMVLKNPMVLFNTGFQMSFIAILTLALMIPMVKKIYNGMFLGSIAIQLGLAPYTAYTFNCFSVLSVFINIPVIILAGIIVPMGVCSMIWYMISGSSVSFVYALLYGLCEILSALNSIVTIDGVTVFSVISPDIRLLCIYYLFLLVFLSEEGRLMFLRKKKKMMVLCAAAVLMISLIFGGAVQDPMRNADIVFVDVGQGDCVHFRSSNGNYLMDGGGSVDYNVGKKTLKPYFLKNGVKKINGAFVTHLHTDHYKGVAELCREGMVEKLFLYEANKVKEADILKETNLEEDDIVYLHQGQKLNLGEVMVDVLWPEKKSNREYYELMKNEEDENAMSLLMNVKMKGISTFITGDIGSEMMEQLAEADIGCHILKVPHHGSKYSWNDNFTESISADFAVFQVGKNNYGHPSQEIIDHYEAYGVRILRNDRQGAIGFKVSGGGINVMTMMGEDKHKDKGFEFGR